jgi:hypothetical protein
MHARLVLQLGRPSRTRDEVNSRGSSARYKAERPKSEPVRRESERDIVPTTVETTQLDAGEAPHFGGAQAARGG